MKLWYSSLYSQWCPIFLEPDTSFIEDNFSTDSGWGGWLWDDSSMIHLMCTLFLLLLHQFHFRSSVIIPEVGDLMAALKGLSVAALLVRVRDGIWSLVPTTPKLLNNSQSWWPPHTAVWMNLKCMLLLFITWFSDSLSAPRIPHNFNGISGFRVKWSISERQYEVLCSPSRWPTEM